MASSLKFVCIVASVREGRLAERMIRLVEKSFEKIMKPKGHSLAVVDPEKYDLPLLKQPLHFYPDPSQAPQKLHELNALVKDADAYIILTAEYNRSMPPALINTLDHLPPPSFEYKPSGIVSYSMGGQAGLFAVSACRPFLAEMGCLPVKHFTAVGSAHKEVNEDGTTANAHIESSLTKLFNQVEWYGLACKEAKEKRGVPQ